jgi:hypothetical protein
MSGESRRGRSIAAGVFVSIVAVFIVITTTQIARGVFGLGAPKSGAGVAPPPACIAGISRMSSALDRAVAATSQTTDAHAVAGAFANAAKPEWDDSDKVQVDCAATPEGQDAFAALLRLRRVEETSLGRHVAEVSPMKQDVAAYLR